MHCLPFPVSIGQGRIVGPSPQRHPDWHVLEVLPSKRAFRSLCVLEGLLLQGRSENAFEQVVSPCRSLDLPIGEESILSLSVCWYIWWLRTRGWAHNSPVWSLSGLNVWLGSSATKRKT